MTRLEDAVCPRCGTAFQRTVKTGQYVRKYCTHKCAVNRHPPIIERFFNKIRKEPGGCWIWTGTKNNYGYPIFYENGKVLLGHKWAYQRFKGPVPAGKVLLHSCDNPSCANPGHMSVGTLSDNSQDMLRKGRSGNTRLSIKQVTSIAERVRGKPVSWDVYLPLAKEFGVSEATIYSIHIGKTWTKITGLPRLKLRGVLDFRTFQVTHDD